jgi:hypothetical protein
VTRRSERADVIGSLRRRWKRTRRPTPPLPERDVVFSRLLYIQNKRRAASRDARTKAALGGVLSIDRFDFRFFRPPNLCEYIYATTKKNKTAALVFSSSAKRTNE